MEFLLANMVLQDWSFARLKTFEFEVKVDAYLIYLEPHNKDDLFNTLFDVESTVVFPELSRADLSVIKNVVHQEAEYLFTAHLDGYRELILVRQLLKPILLFLQRNRGQAVDHLRKLIIERTHLNDLHMY